MTESRTVFIVPLLPPGHSSSEIPERARRLGEELMPTAGEGTESPIDCARILQILEDLVRIHQPMTEAIARVLAANLHVYHWHIDRHSRNPVGQRLYADASPVHWGAQQRPVALAFSAIDRLVPADISTILDPSIICAEAVGDTAVIINAAGRIRDQLQEGIFVVGSTAEISHEAARLLDSEDLQGTQVWTPSEISRHFTREHAHSRPTNSECYLLNAIAVASAKQR